MKPDYTFEEEARAQGFTCIAGVDEVGRGPLAGPVTAAAVILDPERIPGGLNDSKKLTATVRKRLLEEIKSESEICWSVGIVDAAEIDKINMDYDSIIGDRILAFCIQYLILFLKIPNIY